MANAKKLQFEVVLHGGTQGGPTALATVVTSEAAWNALGVKAELPEVDFKTQSLLVVTAGRRPDQGYSLGIVDVIDLSDTAGAKLACVLVEEKVEESGADMLAHPIAVAKVPNTGYHFLFARK